MTMGSFLLFLLHLFIFAHEVRTLRPYPPRSNFSMRHGTAPGVMPDNDLGQDTNSAATKYGRKKFWDSIYDDEIDGEYAAEEYSWYCGWPELRPFWEELVPSRASRVLVVGCGNDICPVRMFDEGWTDLTAFDYSAAGIARMESLFGERRLRDGGVTLLQADARALPLPNSAFDASLDKGTLDTIFISGEECFLAAVSELTRVAAENAIVVSLSRVVPPDIMRAAFANQVEEERCCWEELRDGTLAFAPDGEATIDLGALLYAWRRLPNVAAVQMGEGI